MEKQEASKRLPRELGYEYDIVVKEPRLVVSLGELFEVETEDALNGMIRRSDQLPTLENLGPRHLRREGNPCAGPIYVEGAKAGDVLVVNIHDIVVDDQGVSCIFEGEGPLGDSFKYQECRGPHTTIIEHLPGPSGTTSDGKAVLDGRVLWDLNPHVGTIVTVPVRPIAAGSDSVTGQGPHGGNLDSRDICGGNKVMLPVAVDGACLYLGDVHACQADGEFYGSADESRATLTLSCEVIPQKHIPWVRVETPDAIIQLNSSKPLEEAVKQAFLYMIDWLVEDYGFTQRDAYVQLELNPGVRINVYQMVTFKRLTYTVGVEFPKRSLG